MDNPLRSLEAYSTFLCSLPDRYAAIQRQENLAPYTIGCGTAILNGFVFFANEVRLHARETIDFERAQIQRYTYSIEQSEAELFRYDSTEHPDIPELQSTFPHHKHVPPDLHNNRIPAPKMSFDRPNLPVVIEEIESEVLARRQG